MNFQPQRRRSADIAWPLRFSSPRHPRVTATMIREHGSYEAARAFLAASAGLKPVASTVATAEAGRNGKGLN